MSEAMRKQKEKKEKRGRGREREGKRQRKNNNRDNVNYSKYKWLSNCVSYSGDLQSKRSPYNGCCKVQKVCKGKPESECNTTSV